MSKEVPELKKPAEVANLIAIGAIGYHFGGLLGMGVAILGMTFIAFTTYQLMRERIHS